MFSRHNLTSLKSNGFMPTALRRELRKADMLSFHVGMVNVAREHLTSLLFPCVDCAAEFL